MTPHDNRHVYITDTAHAVCRSLCRDNKHTVEKEQIIKLIRAIVEIGSERHPAHSAIGSGTVPLSDAVMRALIAVAEYPEDPFKPICVQTLTEICMLPDTEQVRLVELLIIHIRSADRYRANGANGRHSSALARSCGGSSRDGAPALGCVLAHN